MEGTLTEAVPTPAQSSGSPWGKVTSTTVPCSLEDVMSEQLADELQNKEFERTVQVEGIEIEPELKDLIEAAGGASPDTSDDVMIARMLQAQYDKEHNQKLKLEEQKFNGTNKVSVSFEKYQSDQSPCKIDDDDDEDEYDDDYEQKTAWEENEPAFNRQGISGKGKNITTKHDSVVCGRRNATKMMEFPPGFEVGDGEGMDMQLPNHVFNKLKVHSLAENKRSQKLHEKKEHSTAEHAMDPRTRLLMYKMVNSGVLESISGSISTGKESVVFHAFGGRLKDIQLPEEVAIKVFKTTLVEFKTREKYFHGDHRFSKDDYKKQNPRKIVKIWAEKETANLNRMKKFQIPCPAVQLLRKHILVMSFIGYDQKPAPKLKETKLSVEDAMDAYEQTVQIMRKLHKDCGLVHADLSEYNMLWWQENVWIIDVSQAVEITHPRAMEFLYRDCCNVSSFFMKCGVHKVLSAEKLFNKVTKLDIKGEGADFVAQVQRYDKEKSMELLAHQSCTKDYPFDYFFDKSLVERNSALKEITQSDSDEEEENEHDTQD